MHAHSYRKILYVTEGSITFSPQGAEPVTMHPGRPDRDRGRDALRRVALPHTGFKALVEEGTDRVLGAHLLGIHAEEVINLFALAIRAGDSC